MKGNRNLNQPLKKLLLPSFSFPPHVFPNFMGVVKFFAIKQLNSATVSVRIHIGGG